MSPGMVSVSQMLEKHFRRLSEWFLDLSEQQTCLRNLLKIQRLCSKLQKSPGFRPSAEFSAVFPVTGWMQESGRALLIHAD